MEVKSVQCLCGGIRVAPEPSPARKSRFPGTFVMRCRMPRWSILHVGNERSTVTGCLFCNNPATCLNREARLGTVDYCVASGLFGIGRIARTDHSSRLSKARGHSFSDHGLTAISGWPVRV